MCARPSNPLNLTFTGQSTLENNLNTNGVRKRISGLNFMWLFQRLMALKADLVDQATLLVPVWRSKGIENRKGQESDIILTQAWNKRV